MTSPSVSDPVFLVDDQLLQTERQCDGRRKLLRDLKVSVYGDVITVPKDFLTDYSTIPWFGSFIVRWSKVDIAGVVHDYLYQSGKYTRRMSDKIWRLTALAGDHRANIFQAWTCWLFLRLGGWLAWNNYRKEKYKNPNEELLMSEVKSTTEAKEPKLTLEAREAVRNYVLSMAVLPGVLSVSFAFFLGLMIKDVAISSAQNKATELMLNEIQEKKKVINEEIQNTKKNLDNVNSELEHTRVLNNGLLLNQTKLTTIAKQSSDALEILGKDPEKTADILKFLEDTKNADELMIKISNLENPKISDNRLTYKIHGITNTFLFTLYIGDKGSHKIISDLLEARKKDDSISSNPKLVKSNVNFQDLNLRPFHVEMQSDRKGGIQAKSGGAILPPLKEGDYYIFFAWQDEGGYNIEFQLNELSGTKMPTKSLDSSNDPSHILLSNNLKLAIHPLYEVSIP